MDTQIITSEKNPVVKLAKSLLTQGRQRKKHAQTVLEGVHLIDAGIKSGICFHHILISEQCLEHPEVVALCQQLSGIPILVINARLYQSIRTLGTGIDIMAMIDIPMPTLTDLTKDCLILNDVQDMGNVGTLLRTAAAVGINHILCTQGTASVWAPKTLRASMGANFSLTIYENVSIDELLSHVKVPLFATSSHTDNLIYQMDLKQPLAWVMGHEGQGVCADIMQRSTAISLPQPNGQESLNVAIAGSLCMYETLRQRHYC